MTGIASIGLPPPLPAPFPPQGDPQMTAGTFGPLTDLATKHRLMAPRQTLVYAVGNTPILVSPAINQDGFQSATDAHNGPVPLACDVTLISGTKTFLVDFAIETYMNESYLYATTPPIILSHRWTLTRTSTAPSPSAARRDYAATVPYSWVCGLMTFAFTSSTRCPSAVRGRVSTSM
jgi:hypothetical protein